MHKTLRPVLINKSNHVPSTRLMKMISKHLEKRASTHLRPNENWIYVEERQRQRNELHGESDIVAQLAPPRESKFAGPNNLLQEHLWPRRTWMLLEESSGWFVAPVVLGTYDLNASQMYYLSANERALICLILGHAQYGD